MSLDRYIYKTFYMHNLVANKYKKKKQFYDTKIDTLRAKQSAHFVKKVTP